jgi:2-deoxy-D-gluconate 3-dehydrogenase
VNKLFDLKDRAVLVTGGNGGLGRGMAIAFRDAGARVAIGARRAQQNTKVLAELGEDAAAFELDVTDEDSVERAVRAVAERFGRLDVLVNNAGTVNRASVMQLDRAAWDRVLTTNLTGAFLCTKHAARLMAERKSGKIINIASLYGLIGPSKGLQVAYTASKHGLVGLTRVNAIELAPLGIQVNAIAPSWFFTEITGEMRGTPLEAAVNRRTPSGHWGEVADLVGTLLFLASPASDFVTGSVIGVDGGYLASDGLDRG